MHERGNAHVYSWKTLIQSCSSFHRFAFFCSDDDNDTGHNAIFEIYQNDIFIKWQWYDSLKDYFVYTVLLISKIKKTKFAASQLSVGVHTRETTNKQQSQNTHLKTTYFQIYTKIQTVKYTVYVSRVDDYYVFI